VVGLEGRRVGADSEGRLRFGGKAPIRREGADSERRRRFGEKAPIRRAQSEGDAVAAVTATSSWFRSRLGLPMPKHTGGRLLLAGARLPLHPKAPWCSPRVLA
jgi:hypothetical protein